MHTDDIVEQNITLLAIEYLEDNLQISDDAYVSISIYNKQIKNYLELLYIVLDVHVASF